MRNQRIAQAQLVIGGAQHGLSVRSGAGESVKQMKWNAKDSRNFSDVELARVDKLNFWNGYQPAKVNMSSKYRPCDNSGHSTEKCAAVHVTAILH